MRWLRTIATELFAVFVDDLSFAAAIVIWLLVACLVLPRIPLPGAVSGVILFAGLGAILIESASRRAGK